MNETFHLEECRPWMYALFFCPPFSPKQGKCITTTFSECISPSFSLEQNKTTHTSFPPPPSFPLPPPQQCDERPGVKCKRENAVVQTVPTTSVSLSLPLCSSSLCLPLVLSLLRSPPPSLPLRWASCCRLQVRGTPQPMKNDCRRAP